MLAMRNGTEASMPRTNPNPVTEGTTPKVSVYEQCREERIKENLQRMQNLGILNLARKLQPETRPVKRPFSNSGSAQKSTPPLLPSRRSSRLENTAPVIYNDGVNGKSKRSKQESVVIGEGSRAEIYTEEHEKLLGNTERSWTCFVDGYDRDGKRIYDPFSGKTCHQCRQKTLGLRTQCSECDMVQGQFCGDCLFMRYGEHILEALENPSWVCPACRGICNCSVCRNQKGWVPTGPIYRRIAKLGYKSVAHYLIQTKRSQTDDATPNQASAKRSLSFKEAKPLPEVADDDLPEEVVPKLRNMESQYGDSLKKDEDGTTKEDSNSARRSLSFFSPSVDEEVPPKPQGMEDQNGDSLKKEEDENTNEDSNSARSSLLLPSVDDETSFVDVQVIGYLEPPPKQDKQEHSCGHIGDDDDLPRIQERTEHNSDLVTRPDGYLLPEENQTLLVDDQTQWFDVQVLSYLEPSKKDGQDQSCAQTGEDLPRIQEKTEQITRAEDSYFLPGENHTLLAVDVQVLCDETGLKGNSVNTPETRSKRKAALEPNPESIGGRLRQRRRIQSGL